MHCKLMLSPFRGFWIINFRGIFAIRYVHVVSIHGIVPWIRVLSNIMEVHWTMKLFVPNRRRVMGDFRQNFAPIITKTEMLAFGKALMLTTKTFDCSELFWIDTMTQKETYHLTITELLSWFIVSITVYVWELLLEVVAVFLEWT